jgi:hAT family dimerisation domain.
MIESLISLTSTIREDVDRYHNEWYNEAFELAEKLEIPVSKPRTNRRQMHRANHASDSVSDFYKYSLTIPLLDHLLQDLSARFSKDTLVSYTGLYLIPSKILSLDSESPEKSLKDLLFPFIQFYEEEFPSVHLLDSELALWRQYWLTDKEICLNNITLTLKAVKFDGFENIKVALRILATLPITSCECERSFSGMRRLKTYSRTTMVNERLNGLALMNFHMDKVPDTENVINNFAGMKNRRLELDL